MSEVRIVSASAGSGKTYRLAEELHEAIVKDRYRPEAVVVTTFTRKAASELQERVRQRLLADGRTDEAQRLMAARIGTVHSVCHGLIRDFAFELGISPRPDVREGESDESIDPHLVEALADVVTPEETDVLAGLASRLSLDGNAWKGAVGQIITLARTNDMSEAELAVSAARSKESLFALLGPVARSAARVDRDLREALEAFLTDAKLLASGFKGDKSALAEMRNIIERLDGDETLGWSEWASLEKLGVTKRGGGADAAARVHAAARGHDVHPRLRADLGAYIDLLFQLAARAMDRYAARKNEQGVLDYDDLESLAYRLLRLPRVQARLARELDLVLVDEFQDTNPIQLAIFLRLASLAKRSVWVGDQKQSIFRFRGADPALMETVLEELERLGSADTLPHSWRSRPELVALVSELFTPAFGRQGIPAERVRLTVPPKKLKERAKTFPKDLGPAVEHWLLVGEGGAPLGTFSDESYDALAAGVRELLDDPFVRVRDRLTGQSRPVRPGDVAVLPFNRKDVLVAIAAALGRQGIPAAVARDSLSETAEAQLLLAALRLWAAPRDSLAAATLARFLDFPEDPGGFLQAGLEGRARRARQGADASPGASAGTVAGDGTVAGAGGGAERYTNPYDDPYADHPVVAAIRQLAADAPWLGLLDAFDRVVALTSLRDLCRRWGDADRRLANLEALRAYVVSYAAGDADAETLHPATSTVPTPAGLIAWLNDSADEEALPGTRDAVSVVNWHRCKGLEWPITVVLFRSRRGRIEDSFEVRVQSDPPTALSPIASTSTKASPRTREGKAPGRSARSAPDRAVAATSTGLDIADPLAGRWIRCWVYPYGRSSYGSGFARNHTPMHRRIEESPEVARDLRQHEREELRLLYVVLTRARDRLVLVQPDRSLVPGTVLSLLNPPEAEPADAKPKGRATSKGSSAPKGGAAPKGGVAPADAEPIVSEIFPDSNADADSGATTLHWAGLDTPLRVRTFSPAEDVEPPASRPVTYPERAPRDYPPAYLAPSLLAEAGPAPEEAGRIASAGRTTSAPDFGAPEPLGDPLPVKGRPDWTALGIALHAILAADRPTLPAARRRAIAERLLAAHGVAGNLTADAAFAASDRLRAWADRRYPGARWRHELPLRYRLPSGTVVRGTADLVLEAGDTIVVIDHKAFPREMEAVVGRSAEVAAQLASYQAALSRVGGLVAAFQHNPLLSQIVELSSVQPDERRGRR